MCSGVDDIGVNLSAYLPTSEPPPNEVIWPNNNSKHSEPHYLVTRRVATLSEIFHRHEQKKKVAKLTFDLTAFTPTSISCRLFVEWNRGEERG